MIIKELLTLRHLINQDVEGETEPFKLFGRLLHFYISFVFFY